MQDNFMKFNEVIKQIILPAKIEQPLSRIYGYQRSPNGNITVVDSEAKIISTVIIQLATQTYEPVNEILDDIVRQFATEGIRNRSGKRWTKQALAGLIRVIYSGQVVSKHGVWRKSRLYPPIVSVNNIKTVLKRIKTEKVF